MSTLDSESTRSYAVVGSSYYHSMSSTITIEGTSWELLAPPLNVRLRGFTDLPDWLLDESPQETRYWQNSSSFWADAQTGLARFERVSEDTYMHNETVLKEFIVKETGRCIAEDAYAWGFSSLLLLTFCCYTFLFALALILLQTDIYWNSRHDRDRQSHSIYTDMLYLAEELKNTFGHNIEAHMQSPKAFEKRVGEWKQGLRLDVRELPLSRWHEWRLSRATKRANRKAKTAPALSNAHDPTLELRNLNSHNRGGSAVSDTVYHGLIGRDGGESSFEAGSRSERRSASEELAPSLAPSLVGVQIPTRGFSHDCTVLEGPVAKSPLLADVGSEDAGTIGRNLQDQLSRRG
jgi:hypothetical protein